MDATTKPGYATEDRIGALEELLNERYSVRAFQPREVPRDVIAHILTTAQRTASWCNSQPWEVLIVSGEAKERFRKAIYAEASRGLGDDYDFTPPREYVGVYLERRRESGFQLYNTLGIARGDRAAYAKQALENYNFFGAPHIAVIHTTSRSASMARSIVAAMSRTSCWPRRRSGSALFRRRRLRAIPA